MPLMVSSVDWTMVKGRINDLEDRSREISQTITQKEKEWKIEQNIKNCGTVLKNVI